MYSESELESAVAAGTLTQEAADALRQHVSGMRATPSADEEQFRLITSFNDIFVAIAGILVLVAAAWIGGSLGLALGAGAVAATSWGLAEFFTLKRRMAFPSIIFFLTFVVGVYWFCMIAFSGNMTGYSFYETFLRGGESTQKILLYTAVSSALVVGASYAHWRRFMVPISIAVGAGAIARMVFTLIAAAIPEIGQWMLLLVLLLGLCMFSFAMWWDIQDRERKTRRSDVAFWLHLAASPMIVHPIFMLLGINVGISDGNTIGLAVMAIVIYALLGVVALIVDRRAILVSALAYVLIAAIYLFSQIGTSQINFAFGILIIGSGLLMLSAFWQNMRGLLLPLLPADFRDKLPPIR
jgi:hypothetical protein